MCMSDQIPRKEVTLEAIKSIVDQSIAKLATKEEVAKLATKEELHQTVDDMRTDLNGHIVETKNRFDGLTLSIDDLPTRAELRNVEQRLESQIDDLAVSVSNEFGRAYIKLADMDNHLVTFKDTFEKKMTGIQSQLDIVYGTYPTRQEFGLHDKRLALLEEAVFV